MSQFLPAWPVASLLVALCFLVASAAIAQNREPTLAQNREPTLPEVLGALGVAEQQVDRSQRDARALGAQLGAAQAEIAALKAKLAEAEKKCGEACKAKDSK